MSASATRIQVSELTAFHPPSVEGERENVDELIIQPRRGWIAVDFRELFRHRELLYFLIWRDIKVRYKQAVLGVGWAVLQPIINMIVFTAIFGVAAGLNKNIPANLPYAIFVFSGLLPWQLFAASLNMGGMSLVNQQHLLTKIYFPRLFVPTAPVGGAIFDMGIASLAFIAMIAFKSVIGPWHFHPTWMLLLVPVILAINVMLGLGMAYLLSALTVTYRDFRFLIPFMVQIWMWVSWVAFPVPPSIVEDPEKWKWKIMFFLNPMHGIISGYRRAILVDYTNGWNPWYLVSSAVIAACVFVAGLYYFRRTERRFADIA